MRWHRENNQILAVLEVGDELHGGFEQLAEETGYPTLAIAAIGAVDEVEIAYYQLGQKRYDVHRQEGIFELASLNGNVTQRDGKAFAHLHAVLGAPDLSAVAGHLVRARVAITVEAVVTPFERALERGAVDATCGLRLIQIPAS